MREKLLEDFWNAPLQDIDKLYIIEVVKYIDEKMDALPDEDLTLDLLKEKMTELVYNIKNNLTGVHPIDNFDYIRKNELFSRFSRYSMDIIIPSLEKDTSTYNAIIDYISIFSNYGGLFKMINKEYDEELNKIKNNERLLK